MRAVVLATSAFWEIVSHALAEKVSCVRPSCHELVRGELGLCCSLDCVALQR